MLDQMMKMLEGQQIGPYRLPGAAVYHLSQYTRLG